MTSTTKTNNASNLDETATLRELTRDIQTNAPNLNPNHIAHLDNLAGIRMYLRDANHIAHTLGPTPRTILDWGCGYGHMAWLLANRGYRVTAASFTNPYQHSERLTHPAITWLPLTDSIQINAARHTFDAIVSSGVLEHVESIHASMTELCRILRPGGYFFLFRFPNTWSYIELISKHTNRWYHKIRMSPPDLQRLMTGYSLEVLRIGYGTMLPVNFTPRPLRWLRPLRERYDAPFTIVDKTLTQIPLLARLSTSIWLVARKYN